MPGPYPHPYPHPTPPTGDARAGPLSGESEDQKERRATARLVLEWTAPKPAVRQEFGPIAAAQPSPEELARMTAELKEIAAGLALP